MKIDADRFPLYWPEGWPRASRRDRTYRYKLSFADARDRLVRELELMGSSEIILSTNIPLRRDGLPRMDVSEPSDPGIAVYWIETHTEPSNGRQHRVARNRVIACDRWDRVRDNMRAVGLAVEALRALQRSGATQVVDRVFTGFAALPANAGASSWRSVLGIEPNVEVTKALIDLRYRTAAVAVHPDKPGGSEELMRMLGMAHSDALRELGL